MSEPEVFGMTLAKVCVGDMVTLVGELRSAES